MPGVPARLLTFLADRYRIEREVGRGGMATVYLAHDLRHHRAVALKVLHPELALSVGSERFLREIRIAAQLQHPHIVPLYDSGQAGELLYYVMPFIEGESLRQHLERTPRLGFESAVRIAGAVAAALDYAHRQGVVHRDIKPENVMLFEGEAMVTDFGIAKAVTAAAAGSLTQTGTVIGTPSYMSPEQAGGDPGLDARSDVYSLGAMLYEMIGGNPPFAGPSVQAIIARLFTEPIPPLSSSRPDVPEWLDLVTTKALAKAPADRYDTAAQFREALHGPGGRSMPPDLALRPPHRITIRRWPLLSGAVLVVSAVTLALDVGGLRQRLLAPGGPARRITSLAVLPLSNIPRDSSQEYFSDGMSEALITELSKIGALKVISRTSAMQYKDSKKPLPQVARELGVDALVEGSVQREGDQVRITVQLVDGDSDHNIWGRTFDRELRGVLALHSEVARAIAKEISATLTPQEETRLTAARAVNPKAYELYVLGRHHWNQRTLEGHQRATEKFRAALELDPGYAPAHAALADTYMLLGEQGGLPVSDARELAADEIRQAIALDSNLAEAYISLAVWKLHNEWDWAGSDAAFTRALELNPGSAAGHQRYGRSLGFAGRFDDAQRELERARELDPLSSTINSYIGQVYLFARQYDRAGEQLRHTLELNPDHALVRHNLGELLMAQGRFREATAELEKSVQLSGKQATSHFLAMLGCGYARSQRRPAALDILKELNRRSRLDLVSGFDMASLHLALGEKTLALHWLEQGYQNRDPWMVELKSWPWFDSLRDDRRFQDLLRRIRFPE
ncbi:MAG TPA: protein kinase [Gemmatimonadales bacterium]|nr:protein kinase [Gemmatimonadales bacterium]